MPLFNDTKHKSYQHVHICKRDLSIEINVNRKIIIGPHGSGKTQNYICPLIALYPARVIYITNRDERNENPVLQGLSFTSICELSSIEEFEKIMIQSSFIENLTDKADVLLEFIEKHKEDKTLVIIDEAAAIFGDKLANIISNPPNHCIIVLQDDKELAMVYHNSEKNAVKDIMRRYWAVISIEEMSYRKSNKEGKDI